MMIVCPPDNHSSGYVEKLLREEVAQRYAIEDIITHQISLQEGATAYQVFDKKMNNSIKAMLLTS